MIPVVFNLISFSKHQLLIISFHCCIQYSKLSSLYPSFYTSDTQDTWDALTYFHTVVPAGKSPFTQL